MTAPDAVGRDTKVEVVVDDGNLPTAIRLKGPVLPEEYGSEIVKGYGSALVSQVPVLFRNRGWSAFDTLPSERQTALKTLEAKSWDQYLDVVQQSFGAEFRAESGTKDASGKAAVVLIAGHALLESIQVEPEWAAKVGPNVVIGEVIRCADDIRGQRARSSRKDDPGLSDQELKERVDEHLVRLLAERQS